MNHLLLLLLILFIGCKKDNVQEHSKFKIFTPNITDSVQQKTTDWYRLPLLLGAEQYISESKRKNGGLKYKLVTETSINEALDTVVSHSIGCLYYYSGKHRDYHNAVSNGKSIVTTKSTLSYPENLGYDKIYGITKMEVFQLKLPNLDIDINKSYTIYSKAGDSLTFQLTQQQINAQLKALKSINTNLM